MSPAPAPTAVADLPDTIPLFPLTGVLLLPGGRLPLNVFEPRYLNMIADVLGGDRLVGMVQPLTPGAEAEAPGPGSEPGLAPEPGSEPGLGPELYRTGCAGRITAFQETEDARLEIILTGRCRFEIADELRRQRGYRRARVLWDRFAGDLDPDADTGADPGVAVARAPLVAAFRHFAIQRDLDTDWDKVKSLPDRELVTWLSMYGPFAPNEKQALLESPNLAERAQLLAALLQMAIHDEGQSEARRN